MAKRVKITGERGRWIAEAEGRWLAVIHTTWRLPSGAYFDPMTAAKTDGKRYAEYVDALHREPMVIIQRDKPNSFERDGYVGIFYFKDLKVGEDSSIRLTLTARYADPAL